MNVIHGIFNVCVFLSPFIVFMLVVRADDNQVVKQDAPSTTEAKRPL